MKPKISITLTDEIIKKIDELVDKNVKFSSRSHLITIALSDLIKKLESAEK